MAVAEESPKAMSLLLGDRLVSMIFDWPTLISINAIAMAFGFSGAIGVFFGFYTARKAAFLNPIEALRYE